VDHLTDRPAAANLPLAVYDGRLRRKSSAWSSYPRLKLRPADEPEDRTRELKTLIGELTIDNECLKALLRKHEERDPHASGDRSRDKPSARYP